MSYQYRNDCRSPDPCPEPSPECRAAFTANGQRGHQQFAPGSNVTLVAEDKQAETYRWTVVVSPPECEASYTNLAPHTILLMLPKPGAYVVELAVTKGNCRDQQRVILWAVTPRRLYRLPAGSEPLRFDGKPEWYGDLGRVITEVDRNLPTDDEKDALAGFNEHHPPSVANPYATREDLLDRPGPPGKQLTDDEVEAIKAGEDPNKCNEFITRSALEAAIPPDELTRDQLEAIQEADDPNRCNPFVTESALKGQLPLPLTEDEVAAIKAGETPAGANPFVTESLRARYAPTANEKAGLNETRTHPPSAQNRYLTEQEVREIAELTPNQKAALSETRDHPPTGDNRFLTELEVKEITELTEAQQAALTEEREHKPAGDNRFLTEREVRGIADELTDNQEAALRERSDHLPTFDNYFITKEELEAIDLGLTQNQREALRERPDHLPTRDNFFVTSEELQAIDPELTDNQKAALRERPEHRPTQENYFITKEELDEVDPELTANQKAALRERDEAPPTHDNYFVTLQEMVETIGLSQNQRDALTEDRTHQPDANNKFLTQKEVEAVAKELTPDQLDALRIDRSFPPKLDNRFITEKELPPPIITPDQKAGLDAAIAPGRENPYLTRSMIPGIDLTAAEVAAIKAGETPSGENEFVTESRRKQFAPTPRQKAALDQANDPHQDNPFATMNDLQGVAPGSRLVAAGTLDLNKKASGATMGGLRVVENKEGWGTATLTFKDYQYSKRNNYVVKALPINPTVKKQKYNEFIAVQFVEFRKDGFVLQMTQPFIHGSGRAALGDCMVEVTEIVCDNPAAAQRYSQELTARSIAEAPSIALTSVTEDQTEISPADLPEESRETLVEAIEAYYNQYIAAGRYAEAWPMVSDQYKTDTGALTLDQFRAGWELTGPAILLSIEAIRVEEDAATFIFELDYRKVGAIYKVQYDFIRDQQQGHARFDYWLFDKGKELERNFSRRRTEE